MTEMQNMVFVEMNHGSKNPCDVCGRQTCQAGYVCRCTEDNSEVVRICDDCLRAGNIDERLEAYAVSLESSAAEKRRMIGRIVAPSYEVWRNAVTALHDRRAIDECPW